MPVFRYKQYREWYDKHMDLMKTYGCDSKEANKYFNSFFCKIKTPNEWRRYQKYRYDMSHKVNHFQKGDKIKLQMEDWGSTIGTSEEIQGIINGEYEGTENHYHF